MVFLRIHAIRNLAHDGGTAEARVSSVPVHAGRKKISRLSKPSVQAGIEERLQAQWRPHHEQGSVLHESAMKMISSAMQFDSKGSLLLPFGLENFLATAFSLVSKHLVSSNFRF